MKKIAIIGAGLSGLTLADQLAESAQVTIFEKHHQASGRIATRQEGAFAFDHGAQFFTAKRPEFQAWVNRMVEAGVVAHWPARFAEIDGVQVQTTRQWVDTHPHYVGVPNMAAIGHYCHVQLLQRGVDVCLNTHVQGMRKDGNRWRLINADGDALGDYDWVVSTLPAHQAAQLMPACFVHQAAMQSVQMQPCYALMLGYHQPLDFAWDAAHISNSILSWVSVNAAKPVRSMPATLVVMSKNQWAATHFNQPEHWVIATMLQAVSALLGDAAEGALQPDVLKLKKWHFANAKKPTAETLTRHTVLIDATQQLASCGDWMISGRVESAYLSAMRLGSALQCHL